jgi:hypothetical protein
MNREQAKKLLPIITAFSEGKDVEYKSISGWTLESDPSFNSNYVWRIKPKTTTIEWRSMDEIPIHMSVVKILLSGDQIMTCRYDADKAKFCYGIGRGEEIYFTNVLGWAY